MKILVVCENFNNGGLETQIKTYYDNLPNDIEMIFAFGNYTRKITLENAKVYENFHFSYSDNIKEFCEDVDRLVNIIKENDIDVIHVHPYYSFFAVLLASQLTKTKVIYTYHGVSSFNFIKTPISSAMFYYAFEIGAIASVLSVNIDGVNTFKKISNSKVNINLFPNPIDLEVFENIKYKENKKWALVSRIDTDKIKEIKLIISKMQNYNIKHIDIYGDGSLKEDLSKFIIDNNLIKKVTLKGYSTNLKEDLIKGYNGVIGIGRVVLEALTLGMPTLLIGFNKITGFINKEVYNEIKDSNFTNIKYNKINYKMPTKEEIKLIQKDIREKNDIKVLIEKYKEIINNSSSLYVQNLEELYKEIKKISQNNQIAICAFHKEKLIYDLIYEYIGKYTLTAEISNIFVNANLVYEMYDLITMRMNELKGSIKNEKS